MASTVDLGRVEGATGPAGPKGADGTKIYTQTSAPTGVATGTVWINI